MDLQEQEAIKRFADQHGADELVVLLGSPDAESARVYAETVTSGDPAWAGPLAGVSLKLPVYHILEDEVKREVEPDIYREQVGIMEMALDRQTIVDAVRTARGA